MEVGGSPSSIKEKDMSRRRAKHAQNYWGDTLTGVHWGMSLTMRSSESTPWESGHSEEEWDKGISGGGGGIGEERSV